MNHEAQRYSKKAGFHEALKEARVKRGWTKYRLAKALGVNWLLQMGLGMRLARTNSAQIAAMWKNTRAIRTETAILIPVAITLSPRSIVVGSCCLPLGSTSCVSPCQRDVYLGDWLHCYECTDSKGTPWCCWYYWKRYLCKDPQPPYEPCHPLLI